MADRKLFDELEIVFGGIALRETISMSGKSPFVGALMGGASLASIAYGAYDLSVHNGASKSQARKIAIFAVLAAFMSVRKDKLTDAAYDEIAKYLGEKLGGAESDIAMIEKTLRTQNALIDQNQENEDNGDAGESVGYPNSFSNDTGTDGHQKPVKGHNQPGTPKAKAAHLATRKTRLIESRPHSAASPLHKRMRAIGQERPVSVSPRKHPPGRPVRRPNYDRQDGIAEDISALVKRLVAAKPAWRQNAKMSRATDRQATAMRRADAAAASAGGYHRSAALTYAQLDRRAPFNQSQVSGRHAVAQAGAAAEAAGRNRVVVRALPEMRRASQATIVMPDAIWLTRKAAAAQRSVRANGGVSGPQPVSAPSGHRAGQLLTAGRNSAGETPRLFSRRGDNIPSVAPVARRDGAGQIDRLASGRAGFATADGYAKSDAGKFGIAAAPDPQDVRRALSDLLDREARLPPAGGTGFDPRLSPAWAGLKLPG